MESADLLGAFGFSKGPKKYIVSDIQKDTFLQYMEKHLPMVPGLKCLKTAPWWLELTDILNKMSSQKCRGPEEWKKTWVGYLGRARNYVTMKAEKPDTVIPEFSTKVIRLVAQYTEYMEKQALHSTTHSGQQISPGTSQESVSSEPPMFTPSDVAKKAKLLKMRSDCSIHSKEPLESACQTVSYSPQPNKTIVPSDSLQINKTVEETVAFSQFQHLQASETSHTDGFETMHVASPSQTHNKENKPLRSASSTASDPDGLSNDLNLLVKKATVRIENEIREKNQNLQNQLDDLKEATQLVVAEVSTSLSELQQSLSTLEKRLHSFSTNMLEEVNPLVLSFLSSIRLVDVPVVNSLQEFSEG
ncbi:hypothetical protein QAD02_000024 [Eretmocerus hayati]|uniref:Uncharacterized protein n=1 Tax=Eretmocerus hayati TaxID=131215 RepID=A0ACC2NC91_9HYME|nr:hypothetical protein QAD02_000024 [Eretmocerus hayati]